MYSVKTTTIETKPGCGNYLLVEIYQNEVKIGEYTRNYHKLFDTFYPFTQNGKDYALYSKCYTATRLMELPSCKDLGGEESKPNGFCPVGYYVPQSKKIGVNGIIGPNSTFGFVWGCVWGDDFSWKIQYLDLTKVSEGIIKREAKFGYLELPYNFEPEKDIIVDNYTQEDLENGDVTIDISARTLFRLNSTEGDTLHVTSIT